MKYSDKVIEHFNNPRNMGELKGADGIGMVGNPVCGDVMWVYIKVKDEKIVDIKFKTLGCAAAIASSSMLTELAKGKTLKEAEKISRMDIVKALDGLPEPKVHCSVLAQDALKEAIKDYKEK
jgi:nitrogen fixation NifU-like protein